MKPVPAGQADVIVCVLEGGRDWDTTAAISWAKQYDPSGERTLFVITKIDQAEAGFRRALDSLQRDHIKAQSQLGYVLVIPCATSHAGLLTCADCASMRNICCLATQDA